jgi:biofilm PGA synthesis N-glycosyltransferase PgaC
VHVPRQCTPAEHRRSGVDTQGEDEMTELFMTYTSYVMAVLLLVYIHRIFHFYNGLSRLRIGTHSHLPNVSVIIPARNEEKNILRCLQSLAQQRYPAKLISLIVVDDHSSDRTVSTVQSYSESSPFPIIIVPVTQFQEITSPKLRALAHGLQHTAAPIIVTTDADCIAHPGWIASIVSAFEERVGVVTGLTVYEKPKNLSTVFWGIQFLDFLSFSSIAAGSIGMGKTLIANGSNMAFRREAFDDTGGFERFKHINSGDDSLLAQNITAHGAWRAHFAFQPEATIITQPAMTVKEFLHQRLRWVGQTAYYPPAMMFFMICTFVLFIALAVTLPLTFVSWSIVPWLVIAGKWMTDYLMMKRFTRITRTDSVMKYFIPTALIHIPYILIATIGGYFFSFEWKERSLKKETAR